MAIGWGDWGLRIYDAAMKPAEGLANVSADAYARGKGESVNVDPRYERVDRKVEALRLKRAAEEAHAQKVAREQELLRQQELARRAEEERRRYENQDQWQKEAAAQSQAEGLVKRYRETSAMAKALNTVGRFIGAPVRVKENAWDPRVGLDLYSVTQNLGNDINIADPNFYIDPRAHYNSQLTEEYAKEAARRGNFISAKPYGKGPLGNDLYTGIGNPFVLKSVPSSGPWKTMEWAQRHPIQAANKASQHLPPAFKNAIWGR